MIVNTENIFGKDGFVWFIGVVEDRKNDPDKLGRVRVRIMGYHSDDLEVLPVESLPWAIVMQPTTSAAVSGLGSSPTNLVEGTWVIGFFLDGKEKQQPIVMGTFGGFTQKVPFCGQESTYESTVDEGISEVLMQQSEGIVGGDIPTDENGEPIENDGDDGVGGLIIDFGAVEDIDVWEVPNLPFMAETEAFQDPNKEYPKCNYIDKPDTNKLATADLEDDDTPVFKKLETRIEGIEVALGGEPWDEPEPAYCAEYPYNQVFETEAGHVVEFDNTPGKERIHIYHSMGTYTEIDMFGSTARKIVGDNFEIIENNDHVYIKGSRTVTIDGACKVFIKGDCDLEIGGNMNTKVDGNMNVEVGGDYNLAIAGNKNEGIGAIHNLITATTRMQTGAWDVTSGITMIESGSLFAVDAGEIHLNSDAASPTAPDAPNALEPAELGEDLIRPACIMEPPEYLEVEVEDYFVDEGAPGIPILELEEFERDFSIYEYEPPYM